MPAFKTSSLTHRPALSRAGEPLSPAVVKCFGAVTFTWQQPCRAHPDQHFREHLTVSKHQPEAARGVGALTSSWRVARAGGDLKIREHGITISEQNTINSCSVLGRLAWHIHAMDTPGFGCLPMPINVQLSQNTACTYWFNMKGNLLSAFVGSFHSLGHIQLHPAQLPHWPHLGQRALPLSSL